MPGRGPVPGLLGRRGGGERRLGGERGGLRAVHGGEAQVRTRHNIVTHRLHVWSQVWATLQSQVQVSQPYQGAHRGEALPLPLPWMQ